MRSRVRIYNIHVVFNNFPIFFPNNKRDCCNGFNTIAVLNMENGLECGTAFWDLALALANGFSIYHTFFLIGYTSLPNPLVSLQT